MKYATYQELENDRLEIEFEDYWINFHFSPYYTLMIYEGHSVATLLEYYSELTLDSYEVELDALEVSIFVNNCKNGLIFEDNILALVNQAMELR